MYFPDSEIPNSSVESIMDFYNNLIYPSYRKPGTKSEYSCHWIAANIFDCLLCQGKTPKLMVYQVQNGKVVPQLLNNVAWDLHCVTHCDGFVYDPVIGYPVSENDYSVIMFGKDVLYEQRDR